MIAGASAPAIAVIVPLVAAVLVFLGPARARPALGIAGTALAGALASWTAWQVYHDGAWRYPLGGWGAPVGIDLYVDGVSALMLLTTALTGLLVAFFASGEFAHDDDDRRSRVFWPLWLFALAAMNAMYVSADLFNLYVTLELLGLAAVGLVLVAPGVPPLAAALRYLYVSFAGSMAYLMGVALAYAETGTLDLYGQEGHAGVASGIALALMTAGLLRKSGVFPLHFWLPGAHAMAPSPVSPLLSGLVVKGSLYIVLRLWLEAVPSMASVEGATLIGIIGVGGIAWGSFEALRQQDLKRLVAYGTVAQLGYVLLLIPLGTAALRAPGGLPDWGADAWFGAFYFAASHAMAKAAMFMAAGIIVRAAGSGRLSTLSGITDALPLTAFAFGLATFTLIGLPPSGGFAGKWHLLSASFASGDWWWGLAIIAGTLLTAAYLLRATWFFFQRDQEHRFDPVPRRMELVALCTAALSVLLGVRTVEVYDLVVQGSPLLAGGG